MEPKKNPKKDLNRKSFLFFQFGLALMLGITLFLIEWKTYDKEQIDTGKVDLNMLEEEDVPKETEKHIHLNVIVPDEKEKESAEEK